MKRFYPGDPEFKLENFWELPAEYVVMAYVKARAIQMDELHYQERPVALLTHLTASINRDKKKQRKPAPLEDFFMYRRKEMSNLPSARYGAAMKKLIQDGLLPSWALFCYKEVMAHAGEVPPALVAFTCDDAIILAPQSSEQGTVEGLLIAKEAASERKLKMRSPCGQEVLVQMPHVGTKFIAEEDVTLRIVG